MAWISVHSTIYGPKLRELYKRLSCSEFEAVGILTAFWHWGLENADREGRILSADKDDIARHLFGRGSGCKMKFLEIVDALIETGWMDEREGNLYIHDWSTWQEQWYKAVEKRKSDTDRKREKKKQTDASGASGNRSEKDKKPAPRSSKSECGSEEKVEKYSEDFEKFWSVYPRKVDKGNAYKKFLTRTKEGWKGEEIVEAARAYASECNRLHTELQYIKHPKTFLSDALPFKDYLPDKNAAQTVGDVSFQGNPFEQYGGVNHE